MRRVKKVAYHLWLVVSRLVLLPFVAVLVGGVFMVLALNFLQIPLYLLGAIGRATVGVGEGIADLYTAAKPYLLAIGAICLGGLQLAKGMRQLKSEYTALDRFLSKSRLLIFLKVQHPEKELTGELPEVQRMLNVEQIVPSVGDTICVDERVEFSGKGDADSSEASLWVHDCVVRGVTYDIQSSSDAMEVNIITQATDPMTP